MPEILLSLNNVFGAVLVVFVLGIALLLAGLVLLNHFKNTFIELSDYVPRCAGWLLISAALVLAIAVLAPQNLPVMVYKLGLVTVAAVMGYYIDRALFPYARPHKYAHGHQVGSLAPHISTLFAAAMLRRSVIVLACILGLTLGL